MIYTRKVLIEFIFLDSRLGRWWPLDVVTKGVAERFRLAEVQPNSVGLHSRRLTRKSRSLQSIVVNDCLLRYLCFDSFVLRVS